MKKISLSAALLLTAPALAGINAWTPVGPDGGSIYGGIRYVAANTAIAASTGGIYQTSDNGEHWIRKLDFNGLTVYLGLAANTSSTAGQQVLAHGDGSTAIFRSLDAGATFSRVEVASQVQHVSATAFTRSGNVAWAGISDGHMMRSADGGATWTPRDNGLPLKASIDQIEVDATDEQRVYLLSAGEL